MLLGNGAVLPGTRMARVEAGLALLGNTSDSRFGEFPRSPLIASPASVRKRAPAYLGVPVELPN